MLPVQKTRRLVSDRNFLTRPFNSRNGISRYQLSTVNPIRVSNANRCVCTSVAADQPEKPCSSSPRLNKKLCNIVLPPIYLYFIIPNSSQLMLMPESKKNTNLPAKHHYLLQPSPHLAKASYALVFKLHAPGHILKK